MSSTHVPQPDEDSLRRLLVKSKRAASMHLLRCMKDSCSMRSAKPFFTKTWGRPSATLRDFPPGTHCGLNHVDGPTHIMPGFGVESGCYLQETWLRLASQQQDESEPVFQGSGRSAGKKLEWQHFSHGPPAASRGTPGFEHCLDEDRTEVPSHILRAASTICSEERWLAKPPLCVPTFAFAAQALCGCSARIAGKAVARPA